MKHNEITVSGLRGLPRARRLTDPVRFVHKNMAGSKQQYDSAYKNNGAT
jgi:hypothetical protein